MPLLVLVLALTIIRLSLEKRTPPQAKRNKVPVSTISQAVRVPEAPATVGYLPSNRSKKARSRNAYNPPLWQIRTIVIILPFIPVIFITPAIASKPATLPTWFAGNVADVSQSILMGMYAVLVYLLPFLVRSQKLGPTHKPFWLVDKRDWFLALANGMCFALGTWRVEEAVNILGLSGTLLLLQWGAVEELFSIKRGSA